MAIVRLGKHTDEEGDLPAVCMKCGAPATLHKDKNFAWYPRWVYILIVVHILVFLIVAVIMTKRRLVSVPLCDEHKGHWLWRQLAMLGSFAAVCVVGVGAVIVMVNAQGDDALNGVACGGGVVAFIAWLILVAILSQTAIRPTEITDRSITLTGVSEEFVRAYEDDRLPAPPRVDKLVRDEWDRPERRPRRADDDRFEKDDPDEPRRRRPRDTYRPEDD